MKPRRVFVTLELMTLEHLDALRDRSRWHSGTTHALQVQVNVARAVTPKKKPCAKKKS